MSGDELEAAAQHGAVPTCLCGHVVTASAPRAAFKAGSQHSQDAERKDAPEVLEHPGGADQNLIHQEEAQIMTNAIPNPIIGLDVACPEPGCVSVPELHGPSERGVAPVAEVHTIADVDDIDGRFRVGGMRGADDPWALTIQVQYALTPAQGNRLAHAVLVTSAKLAILERTRRGAED